MTSMTIPTTSAARIINTMAHGKSPKHTRKARKKASSPSRAKAKAKGLGAKRAAASSREQPAALLERSVRIQKLLAAAGFGSRRDVEQFIVDQRVTVNGRVAKLGDSADPAVDKIRLDGERLLREKPSYWILNKPRGVVTTVRDDEGRKTVIDLLPRKIERLFPVGRLDRETSGLLLMTNDGDTAHALLHPSLGNEREYRVNVKGRIDAKAVGRLEKGVSLEEGRTSPGRVSAVRFDTDSGNSSFTLVLMEGRKRQIRRSLLILGFPVRRLVRVRMGSLRLGRLPVGQARPLRAEERRALLAHVAKLREGASPSKKRGGRAKPQAAQRTASSKKGVRK
jgi:23S rRNA pseudouridine2605 synthase